MKLFPLRPMLWAAGACVLTVVSMGLGERFDVSIATAVPALLLLVILVAWRAGFRASLTVSLVATLSLDYFLTKPHRSLEVGSADDIVTLVMFAASAVVVSQMSHRTHLRAAQLEHAREKQAALYSISRDALLIDWRTGTEEQLAKLLFEKAELAGVGLFNADTQSLALLGDAQGAKDRMEAAYRAKRGYDLPTGQERLRILQFGSRPLGCLLLRGTTGEFLADALCTLVATHLVRTRAVQSEVKAQAEAFSERLRSAVLDGLAHAIKTPLTTIIVSSSGLREVGPLSSLQDQLANTIEEQAEHLAVVTNTLLRTADLSTQDVKVEKTVIDLALFGDAVKRDIKPRTEGERIHVLVSGLPEFLADARLLGLSLQQLLENALKYSPADTPVSLTLQREDEDGSLKVAVHNEGSFIPAEEQGMIFERYYRAASTAHRASGTGIGLSVARSAIEAMQGHIRVDSNPTSGTTFYITLPGESE